MLLKSLTVAAATLVVFAGPALAQPGSDADPIPVHMKRGSDQVTLRGRLGHTECCAYSFKARGGQQLIWKETGAAARVTITYPDGKTDGGGLSSPLMLPYDGRYVFTVSPNMMADGATGPFKLTLKIPPSQITPGTSVNPK